MFDDKHYQAFVVEGIDPRLDDVMGLAAMGLAGEAGEVVDEIKKIRFHGKPVEIDKLIEEMGDVLWYLVLMCQVFGVTLGDLAKANRGKLVARYPERHPNG